MVATIQKWGNSNAIRLPKVLLDELYLNENDEVNLSIINETIQITKNKKHKSLKKRFKEFYGKDLTSYPAINEDELIVGTVGEEI